MVIVYYNIIICNFSTRNIFHLLRVMKCIARHRCMLHVVGKLMAVV